MSIETQLPQVEEVRIDRDLSIRRLVDVYRKAHGFMASHLVKAIDILLEMKREADLRVLTFTANIVATGFRGLLAQLIESKVFNLVITTCGTIDHDIAKSFGGKYLKGWFDANDVELKERGVHRLGNIFIPMESYGPTIERAVYRMLDELIEERGRDYVWGIRELLTEFGKRINDRNSILRAAYVANVPIYVPGFVDGAFGTALFTYSRIRGLRVDVFKDMQELADHFFGAKKLGALIIGGGISKHHAIWWAQFKEGFDYVVYITTAIEWDGSLSGARPREAITWGKIKSRGRTAFVYCDATIVLPIIAYMLLYE